MYPDIYSASSLVGVLYCHKCGEVLIQLVKKRLLKEPKSNENR